MLLREKKGTQAQFLNSRVESSVRLRENISFYFAKAESAKLLERWLKKKREMGFFRYLENGTLKPHQCSHGKNVPPLVILFFVILFSESFFSILLLWTCSDSRLKTAHTCSTYRYAGTWCTEVQPESRLEISAQKLVPKCNVPSSTSLRYLAHSPSPCDSGDVFLCWKNKFWPVIYGRTLGKFRKQKLIWQWDRRPINLL